MIRLRFDSQKLAILDDKVDRKIRRLLADHNERCGRRRASMILECDRHVARITAELEIAFPFSFDLAPHRRASWRQFDLRDARLLQREGRGVAALAHLARDALT